MSATADTSDTPGAPATPEPGPADAARPPGFFRMLAGFPGRLGQLLIAPQAALRRIDAEGGGFRDAVVLIVLGAVALRFPQLAEAVLGLQNASLGALSRVLAVLS